MSVQEKGTVPQIIEKGHGFDDVLILPRLADVESRRRIDTSSIIVAALPRINIPVFSANMDTVTESEMAETMAKHGGVGVIHRFMTLEDEATQVRLVKEKMRVVELDPPKVPESATVGDVKNLLSASERKRGYVIVFEGPIFDGSFSGIATPRDYEYRSSDIPISEVMTKKANIITVPEGTSLEIAVSVMRDNRIQKVPIVKSDGKLYGVYTLKDKENFDEYPYASLDDIGRLMVGAAIGVKDIEKEIRRAHLLEEAGADFLVLDIAHGGLKVVERMLKKLKIEEKIRVPIIAGNVATAEGIIYLRNAGADGAKVGVGPGLVCETRDVAGVGVPQVTAIMDTRRAVGDNYPIIADGGIRKSGDLVKALTAGADTVMIGSLLAGTDKSPGEVISLDGGKYVKMVRGMASQSAFEDKMARTGEMTNTAVFNAEGRVIQTPFKGPNSTVETLYALKYGLQSGMSYIGANSVEEMPHRAIFIETTPAGASEHKRELGM